MAWDSASGVIPSAAARVSACRRVSRPVKIWSSNVRIALDSLTVVRSPFSSCRSRCGAVAAGDHRFFAAGAALLRVLSRLRPPSRVSHVLTHRLCGRRAVPLTQRGQNRLVLVRGLPPRGSSAALARRLARVSARRPFISAEMRAFPDAWWTIWWKVRSGRENSRHQPHSASQ